MGSLSLVRMALVAAAICASCLLTQPDIVDDSHSDESGHFPRIVSSFGRTCVYSIKHTLGAVIRSGETYAVTFFLRPGPLVAVLNS